MAVGAKLWLVRPLGFRMDEKTLRRAGLDYWEHLEWEVVDDWSMLASRLADRRCWFFSKSASKLYTSVEYQPGDAMIFGSETQGLPTTLLEQHRQRALRVPIRQQVRSLNLASTVAVCAYEALRQWHAAGILPDTHVSVSQGIQSPPGNS